MQAFARAGLRAAPRAAAAFTAAGVFGVSVAVAAPAAAPKEVPAVGLPGTRYERSFVAIKPDAVQRGLIAPIIAELETKGYKLVAMKMVRPTKAMAEGHYEDLKAKPFFPGLVEFFSSGPVIAMVWEGQGVVKGVRHLLGATNPEAAPAGSIRSRFSVITGRNIIHASDSTDSAAHEIGFWFKPSEVVEWTRDSDKWVYEN